jgi:enterochelin esterase-like enzyme
MAVGLFYNFGMQRRTFQKYLVTFILLPVMLSSCIPQASKPISTPLQQVEAIETLAPPRPSPTPATQTVIPSQTAVAPKPECTETKGVLASDALPAEGINAEVPFKIYLPPCYSFDSKTRYPLLILLHGSGPAGDENMWPNFGLAETMDQKIAAGMAPFLVVTPRIYNLQGDIYAVSQTIAKTLVAYVDAHYRTITGYANQALGGLSYGAIWTLRTATVYPQEFGKIGLHSNAAELDDIVAFSQKLLTFKADKRPLIWLDAGINDYYLWSDTKMDEVLNNDRISHFWQLNDGSHDQAYWTANLADYLDFYSSGW